MNHHTYTPVYRRILLTMAFLVIGLMTAAAMISFSEYVTVPHKPAFGVVRGVVYSPPNSCAVVDREMVHEGDEICDVSVVAIQSDSVEFSKQGVTWRQEVLEVPNKTWTETAQIGTCDGQ